MPITHEEAHKLIQFNADEILKGVEKNLLEAHLDSCESCRIYAGSIQELESTLMPVMQRRWNQHPLPQSRDRVVSGRTSTLTQNVFFATRITALCVIFLAFLFNVWQFTQSTGQKTMPPVADIPLIPTPSLQSTRTMVTEPQCEPILYEVRENDTLESIANQFSMPVEEIVRMNNIRTGTLNRSEKLTLTVCSLTPSGMQNAVNTTFTPLLGPTTLTPANSPTQ
jgi:hypothetical protein